MTALTKSAFLTNLKTIVPHMQKILPKHLTAERMLNIGLVAASKNPMLLECEPISVLRCMMQASTLGLEPDTPLGLSYLVPFRNHKTGKYECQLITGYRGLIDLARRSGNIESIEAHCVFDTDEFDFELGLTPKLKHRPSLFNESKRNFIAAYAIAKLVGGGVQFEVMSVNDIEEIRLRSKASKHGPWVTDYNEMAKKTVIRRLSKYLPLSTEFADSVGTEDGEPTVMSKEIDLVLLGDSQPDAASKDGSPEAEVLGALKDKA